MSHVLHDFPKYFQWLSVDSGSSTQHVCDMTEGAKRGKRRIAEARARAVERLEEQYTFAVMRNDDEFAGLPLDVARDALAGIRDGIYRGLGRGRPWGKSQDRVALRATVQLARQRQAEYVAAGTKPGPAKRRAAAEALKQARNGRAGRFNWSPEYVEDLMSRRV